MKRKFSYKRFSIFVISLLVLTVFFGGSSTVKYSSFNVIGKLFRTGNEKVISIVKADGDNGGSFEVSGQTLRYRQTYLVGEEEMHSDYFINVRRTSDDEAVAVDSETFELTIEAGREYYVSIETEGNLDPTDLCLDAGAGCVSLWEVESYKENTRRSDSEAFAFDEDVIVEVRFKSECDRLGGLCFVEGFNISMMNDGQIEYNNEMIDAYYGMVNYTLLDNNGIVADRNDAQGETNHEISDVSLDGVTKLHVAIDLYDNENNRVADYGNVRILRLYRDNNNNIFVSEVRREDTEEYQASVDKENFRFEDAIVNSGVTFNVEFEHENEQVRPYGILVFGNLRRVGGDEHNQNEQRVNVRFNVGNGRINEGREFIYVLGEDEVTLTFVDNNLSADENGNISINYSDLNNIALSIEGFDSESMELLGFVPGDGFTTALMIDNGAVYLRPADAQTVLPGDMNNFDVNIMPRQNGNEPHYEERTIRLDGNINGNSASFNVNGTVVTAQIVNGEETLDLNQDITYSTTEGTNTIKDPEGFDVEVPTETMVEKILIKNMDLKYMDVWVYDDWDSHFQNKLTPINNEYVSYEKTSDGDYLVTLTNPHGNLPNRLVVAITEKYEYPENMPNVIEFSISGESNNVNVDNNTVNVMVGETNVTLRVNGLDENNHVNQNGDFANFSVTKEELDNITLELTGFDNDNMFVSYDMNGARGLVSVKGNVVDLGSLVLSSRIDLIIGTRAEGFDGRAYFVWECAGSSICYHKVEGLTGRTFLTNSSGMVILDDMGEPYQTYNYNYFNVTELTDESNNHVDLTDALEEHNNDINDHFANWVLAKDVEDASGNFTASKNEAMGEGEDHGYQLDPTGGVGGVNSFGSNGDRNFRSSVYVGGEYEAITFEASPLKYTYFPSFWNQVFFSDTRDVSGTTKEYPALYETYLLEPKIVFTTGVHSKSPIVDVKALDINSKAVSISENNGEFTIIFNSNYYDNVVFELTDANSEKYYINITRTLATANYKRDSHLAIFELYHPIDFMSDDFEVVATVNLDNGESVTRVLASSDLVSPDSNFEMSGRYTSGGKNLFYSQYNLDLDDLNLNSNVIDINYTVVLKNALNSGNVYGGTFAGSGKGITLRVAED